MAGQLIGVGVGPGDPELITLKALRFIRNADVISYMANVQGVSQAKNIAATVLGHNDKVQTEIALLMPMCSDRSIVNAVYDKAAKDIQQALNNNQSVVFLCEGDPLFFGSFSYVLERIKPANDCLVVPGVASIQAASARLQLPLTLLKESFAVVSGRHSEQSLLNTLICYDSVIIMKAGRARKKILAALNTANRLNEAYYLEYIGRSNEYIQRDVALLPAQPGPYFSLFVVTRTVRNTQ